MDMQNRDFKGIWIPKEIWLDDRLSALDKFIFAEVDSLDGKDGCWASNEYIAEFCQCSATKASLSISKLIKLGYLEKTSFDGRTRVLKSRLSKNERQTDNICKADIQKVKVIDNKIENINKENNKKKKKFIKPTYDEVKAFAVEKGREDLLDEFYLYYTELNWCDKYGNEIIVWKSKFNTWCQRKPKETTDNQLPTCTAHQVNGVWKI